MTRAITASCSVAPGHRQALSGVPGHSAGHEGQERRELHDLGLRHARGEWRGPIAMITGRGGGVLHDGRRCDERTCSSGLCR